VSQDSVWALHERGDDRRKVISVVLRVVCGWRHVFAVAMSTKIEKHAAKLSKLQSHWPPDAPVAAVAMQTEQRDCVSLRRTSRRPDYFVRKRWPRAADSKLLDWRFSVRHGVSGR